MTATSSSAPVDNLSSHPARNSHEDPFDPLPDETVLKTGWLLKKGRHGVLKFYGKSLSV